MRLIDANALLAELDKFVNPMPDANGLHFLSGLSTAITEIVDAPTVDAVEVGHCKYCYYYEPSNPGHGYCKYFDTLRIDNDFCSSWERKSNG